ncbi:MAG: hypothetical protein V2J55_11860 [Candidatus Competibacteraceae bacterium]|jgi:predicted membrane protein (TIGR00267 family)|nr:hypothetical protein [Candidatus Competibacteraceae bacterium]
MIAFADLRLLLKITRSQDIARRYFVVNGFDGALTMLGLNVGFYVGDGDDLSIMLSACIGAAVALGMSGLSSAYISETAERKRWLADLESAMVTDLQDSAHNTAAKIVPLLVALVNGLAPLLISLFIITPFWLAQAGVGLPLAPVESAILLAFVAIFGLGVFLGQVSGGLWLWGGLKAILIAAATTIIIFLVES